MPLESAKTFPPQAYTNAQLFNLETNKIFRPGWMCVAHASQIKHKGDYATVDLLGELMVVVNDGDEIRVLSRICTHRWAPLVAPGAGTCSKGKFTCPFHRWSFDLDGSCAAAPLMPGNVDLQEHALPAYKTQVVDGFVFVNLDGTAEPLALQEMTDSLQNWELAATEMYLEMEYDCAFNWKIVVETFMECYHHVGAHATTFEPNFPAKLSWTEDARPEGWTVGHAAPRPGREKSAYNLGLPHFPKLADNNSTTMNEHQAYALFHVFPTHLMHVMPDRVLWFQLQPVAPDRTIVTTYALVPPATKQMVDYETVRAEQAIIMDEINMEDIAVNTMQQIGAKAGTTKAGTLNADLEKALWQLNTFVARKLCGDDDV
jgi:phenylpropionate dioxygenase-like ring-hydroxylating dioxygenase large terminal subunit